MAIAAAPIFYDVVSSYLNVAFMVLSLVVQAVALVHCITRPGSGFVAIGTLPKGAWIAILAICMLLTYTSKSGVPFFPMVGIAAALIYLLDVRVGLRDLTDGKGFW